jgi:ethanolamine utilization microcompartment shell protein EutS
MGKPKLLYVCTNTHLIAHPAADLGKKFEIPSESNATI